MIAAENAVLQRGGNAIRLSGLYSEFRGAHTYWFKQAKEGKVIETNSNGLVNLIHYEDAARAVLATLDAGKNSLL